MGAGDMTQPTNGAGQVTAAWSDFDRTGPGTLAGRYLRLFWQPVFISADLPNGRTKPIRIMSEDFTLYRGESGDAHMVAFRCAHRGTQLSTGWVEGDEIRCFYHGWKYGPDGQCIEQPAEPEPFCNRIKIRSYPVQEYLGLIFAYLGEGEPPELPRYPDFEGEGVLATSTYTRACSYFNSLENGVDPAHLAFVHRRSGFADNGLVDVPMASGEETEYGIVCRAERPGGSVRLTHHNMPNMLHIKSSPDETGSGWTDAIAWRVPVEDDFHVSYNVNMAHLTGEAAEKMRERRSRGAGGASPVNDLAASILAGEKHVDDLGQPPYIVGVQDTVAQVGQGALADRVNEHIGRSDAVILLLRRIWERELRALDEGRPLKEWTRPNRVEATAGV
jgi:5,5'-dehydrodivanillate O-demethylase oxygenase subunit